MIILCFADGHGGDIFNAELSLVPKLANKERRIRDILLNCHSNTRYFEKAEFSSHQPTVSPEQT